MVKPASSRCTVRSATREDCKDLWELRNEPDTRKASFNEDPIEYIDHEKWFLRHLKDPSSKILIVENESGRTIGYARFKMDPPLAKISVTINKNERSKGYGTAAIQLASDHILHTKKEVRTIIAEVRKDNARSISAFEQAGFTRTGWKQISGKEACEMMYKSDLKSDDTPC